MPRGTRSTTPATRTRRRTTRARSDTAPVVAQITRLVAASETLKRQNAELTAENQRLRAELLEIGAALGRLTAPPRGRGRRGAAARALVPEVKPRRQHKPITDPLILERRRQALAKARAARSEKLAAARDAAAVSQ